MNPNIVKEHLYRLALHQDPQSTIMNQRVAATTVGQADTFIQYNLDRVTYRPATVEELELYQANIGDRIAIWTITSRDLEVAGNRKNPPLQSAPAPQDSWQLVINGNTWNIENVSNDDFFQRYVCVCRWIPNNNPNNPVA